MFEGTGQVAEGVTDARARRGRGAWRLPKHYCWCCCQCCTVMLHVPRPT